MALLGALLPGCAWACQIVTFFRVYQPLRLGWTPHTALKCIQGSCCPSYIKKFRLAVTVLIWPTETPNLYRLYNTSECWMVAPYPMHLAAMFALLLFADGPSRFVTNIFTILIFIIKEHHIHPATQLGSSLALKYRSGGLYVSETSSIEV